MTCQDRRIVHLHCRDRTISPAGTAPAVEGGRGVISADTERRRLRSAGLRVHRPYVGPTLTDRHRNERQRWAGRYRHWRLQRWRGVLYSLTISVSV